MFVILCFLFSGAMGFAATCRSASRLPTSVSASDAAAAQAKQKNLVQFPGPPHWTRAAAEQSKGGVGGGKMDGTRGGEVWG